MTALPRQVSVLREEDEWILVKKNNDADEGWIPRSAIQGTALLSG